jgi:hypothetical protein
MDSEEPEITDALDRREEIVKFFAELTSLDFATSRQRLKEANWHLNVKLL